MLRTGEAPGVNRIEIRSEKEAIAARHAAARVGALSTRVLGNPNKHRIESTYLHSVCYELWNVSAAHAHEVIQSPHFHLIFASRRRRFLCSHRSTLHPLLQTPRTGVLRNYSPPLQMTTPHVVTSSSGHHSQATTSNGIVGNQFRVGKKIGEGSFGVVFEGRFIIVIVFEKDWMVDCLSAGGATGSVGRSSLQRGNDGSLWM